MNTFIYILILALVSVGLTNFYSQEAQKAISNLEGKVDNNIRLVIENNISNFPNNTQISLAIINKQKTEYIGIIRKNDTLQIINNQNNIFEIGSISKVFTSVLFSKFIHDKKAYLDETIASNFDFNIKEGGEINLQQLANHTSGLAKLPSNIGFMQLLSEQPYINYTSGLLKENLTKDIKLKNKVGKKSKYSNFGAGLLGYILTRKERKTYEDILQKYICKPLNMTKTTSDRNKISKDKLIKGLDKKGKETSNWDFTDVLIGAGGIKSCVVDLEKFVRKNFENDEVYNLTHQPTFTISDKMKIGLGWHILSKDNILWHNGGTGGYKSCLTLNKEKEAAVIVLSNVSGLSKKGVNIDKLCIQLLKQIIT